MTKRVFVAEKSSLARTVAEFLAKESGQQVSKVGKALIVGNDTVVSLRGHVLKKVDAEIYDPKYKVWKASHLPIIPNPWQLSPAPDRNGSTRDSEAMIATVKAMTKTCDVVINVGDCDAEGELLVMEVLYYIKNSKPVQRLWAAGLDDSSLTKALAGMKEASEYHPLYESALARSNADWLYGINMTRACTLAAQKRGANLLLSIGRVQTPTLALIVNRELEIKRFKSVSFYVPWLLAGTTIPFKAEWEAKAGDDRVDSENRLLSQSVAYGIASSVKASGSATVSDYKTTKGTESAPLPFSLSSLQTHCSRLFGLGAAETLAVAQKLYELKITSYPRSDCEYITEELHAEAGKILSSLAKAPLPTSFGTALRGAKPALKSRAFDNKKISSHWAIVPLHLDNPGVVGGLADIDRKVYCEIVKRYLQQFWPVATFLGTTITLHSAGEVFTAKGKRYTDEGWRKAFASQGVAEDEDAEKAAASVQSFPDLKIGQTVPVKDTGCDSKSTKAPKRYTEGTLITAMTNVHQHVTDPKLKARLKGGNGTNAGDNQQAGIGTVATRANVIQTLFQRKFITLGGKVKELIPTDTGMKLVSILPKSMTAPDMTAMWQMFSDSILAKKSTYDDFMHQQNGWISEMVVQADSFFTNVEFNCAPPRTVITETKLACSCGGMLNHISGTKEGRAYSFFGCQNAECKKSYTDKEGKPVERALLPPGEERPQIVKTAHKCNCGAVLKWVRGTKGRRDYSFFSCTSEKCKITYNEVDGKPSAKPPVSNNTSGKVHACPACKKGNLRRIKWQDRFFWACTRSKEEHAACKVTFKDVNEQPDLTTQKTSA